MPDNLETTFFVAEHFVAAYSAKRATLSVVERVTTKRQALLVERLQVRVACHFYPQQGVCAGFIHLTFKMNIL